MSRFTQQVQPQPAPSMAQPKAAAPQAGNAAEASVAQLDQSITELSGAMLDAAQGGAPAASSENEAMVATVGAVANVIIGMPVAEIAQAAMSMIRGTQQQGPQAQGPQQKEQTSSFFPGAVNAKNARKSPDPVQTRWMSPAATSALAWRGQQSILTARHQATNMMPGQSAPKGRHADLAARANIASTSLSSGTRGMKSSLMTSSSMTNVEKLKRDLGIFQHARNNLSQQALDSDANDQRISNSLQNAGAEVQTKFKAPQMKTPQVKMAPPVPAAPKAPTAAA